MDFKETEEDTDTETKTEKVSVADYRNLEADVAAADAQKSGLQPVVIGNGKKVQKQSTGYRYFFCFGFCIRIFFSFFKIHCPFHQWICDFSQSHSIICLRVFHC